MGLDIIAISKAVRVPCQWVNATEEEVADCEKHHITVGDVYRKKEGIKPGCYIPGKGGREFDFRAGSASGYGKWRKDLCLFALGVTSEDFWQHRRRYRGKPFFELIEFPGSMTSAIGPVTSAQLYANFVRFAAKAKRHYFSLSSSDQDWMWENYRSFRRAFKIASDGGFVLFS